MKVKEMTAGTLIDQPLLVGAVNEGVTASGNPYLSVTLQDASGSIDAKLWDVKPAQREVCVSGKIIRVKGDVINYKGRNQMKILMVAPYDGPVRPEDFRQASPVNVDSLKEKVQAAAASIKDPYLSMVVAKLLEDAGEAFYSHPAASKNHHEFKGGLATHVTGMLSVAEAILPLYPMLNADLLRAGVLVHDIGKLYELSDDVVTSYTLRGKLLGHISIGCAMVEEAAKQLGCDEEESVILLEHMILSHHGEYEYGSPVLPLTPEAEVLHMIDNLDARMEILRKAFEQTKDGEFTLRLFPLENRSFYKMKK